jgi:hypothetical protein
LVYAGIGASGPQRPARYQQDPTDILTKQKLQELIRQVAPNDRLEPEVEEVPPQRLSFSSDLLARCSDSTPNVVCSQLLQDIAEDFVESVTTFACSLAKLRKVPTAAAAAASFFVFTWGHVATRACSLPPSHPRPTSRIAWTPRTLPSTWNETGIFKYRVPFPYLYPHAPFARSCVLTPFVCASGYSPELDVMSVASGSPTLTQSTVASLKRPLPEGHKQRLALVKKTMALQRKREEKEREKERKQREDQKERGKQQQQQQQLQAHQQAEKQQQQRAEASGELAEKKATTPDLEAEVKKEKSEMEKSEAAAAAAGDEATTEKNEKKNNEEAEAEEDEEEAGDEVKKKKQKTLQEPAEAKRDGEASEKEAGGDMQTE